MLSKFFERMKAPTSIASRREFKSLGPMAEPACTLSNIPMFAVAFYYKDPTLMFAATFSALSHAIPNQLLHDLDIVGCVGIGMKAFINRDIIMSNPNVLLIGAVAVALNISDTIVSRKYQELEPFVHVAWHIMAAVAMQQFDAACENNASPATPSM